MTINHQEILRMLESHDPNTELSESVQRRQDQIQYIMEQENPDQTKDLITVAQDFKELMNLGGNELRTRYLTKLEHQYPDFEFELKNGSIHASLICKNLEILPEFPPGLKDLYIWDCPNIETLPEFLSSLERLRIESCPKLENVPEFPERLKGLYIEDCPNLTQETRDRIKEFQG